MANFGDNLYYTDIQSEGNFSIRQPDRLNKVIFASMRNNVHDVFELTKYRWLSSHFCTSDAIGGLHHIDH